MTTTEIDEIMKQVESAMPIPYHLNRIDDKTHILHLVRTAIASVIGKERPKIDLNEVELLVEVFAEVHGGKTETIESYWRKKIGYTLDDLTPKTDTTDGE